MKDRSTSVGGRRNKTGNDSTAGNSVGAPGKRRSFGSSKTQSVAKQNNRFKDTRTRSGKSDAV